MIAVHPFKALRSAWDAFWSQASKCIRADSEGFQIESYRKDIELYQAFMELKEKCPAAVDALVYRAARVIYEIVNLNPGSPNYSERLTHLHGQLQILTKDVLTDITNAELYLEIARKELSKAQTEQGKRGQKTR